MKQLFNTSLWNQVLDTSWDKEIKGEEISYFSFPEHREEVALQLLNGTYRFNPPHLVTIPKDDGGTRNLLVLEPKDRIVMQLLYHIYYQAYSCLIHYSCKSYQSGLSISKIVKEVQYRFSCVPTGYKLDLSKFFDTVPINLIDEAFSQMFPESGPTKCLLDFYHDNHIYKDGDLVEYYKSLCQGCSFSSLLANIVLRDIDDYITARTYYYVRYSDDILFLTKNPDDILNSIESLLQQKSLKLNPNKIQKLGESFTFLGVCISSQSLTVSKKNKNHTKKDLNQVLLHYSHETSKFRYLSKAIRATYRFLGNSHGSEYSLLSYWFSLHGDFSDIEWLETYCKDTIRAAFTHSHNITHNLHVLPNKLFKKFGWHTFKYLHTLYNTDTTAFNAYMRYLGNQDQVDTSEKLFDMELDELCKILNKEWKYAKYYNKNTMFLNKDISTTHTMLPYKQIKQAYLNMIMIISMTSADFKGKAFIKLDDNLVIFQDWFQESN